MKLVSFLATEAVLAVVVFADGAFGPSKGKVGR
jgi:hypothetical protein